MRGGRGREISERQSQTTLENPSEDKGKKLFPRRGKKRLLGGKPGKGILATAKKRGRENEP